MIPPKGPLKVKSHYASGRLSFTFSTSAGFFLPKFDFSPFISLFSPLFFLLPLQDLTCQSVQRWSSFSTSKHKSRWMKAKERDPLWRFRESLIMRLLLLKALLIHHTLMPWWQKWRSYCISSKFAICKLKPAILRIKNQKVLCARQIWKVTTTCNLRPTDPKRRYCFSISLSFERKRKEAHLPWCTWYTIGKRNLKDLSSECRERERESVAKKSFRVECMKRRSKFFACTFPACIHGSRWNRDFCREFCTAGMASICLALNFCTNIG